MTYDVVLRYRGWSGVGHIGVDCRRCPRISSVRKLCSSANDLRSKEARRSVEDERAVGTRIARRDLGLNGRHLQRGMAEKKKKKKGREKGYKQGKVREISRGRIVVQIVSTRNYCEVS